MTPEKLKQIGADREDLIVRMRPWTYGTLIAIYISVFRYLGEL